MVALCVLDGGCTRPTLAQLVPKLDLSCHLRRARDGARIGANSDRMNERLDVGIGAALRWQPAVYPASVRWHAELAPAAWLAPCALDDAACLAEYAEAERELASALRDAP
jgi:hypothetical protein